MALNIKLNSVGWIGIGTNTEIYLTIIIKLIRTKQKIGSIEHIRTEYCKIVAITRRHDKIG